MASPVEIYVAAVNSKIGRRELPKRLAEISDKLLVYYKKPPPGEILASSADWFLLLDKLADVLTYAQAIWAVYQLVRNHGKASVEKPPELIISMKTRKEPFENITIKGPTTKKEFMDQFVSSMEKFRSLDESIDEDILIDDYAKSDKYQRIKPGEDWSSSILTASDIRAKLREDD